MSAKPDSMATLFAQIDAGNISTAELPTALRQAGGVYMAIVAAVRQLASSSGGAAWGSITGTLSSQIDLQSALNAKAGLGANTFTRKQAITESTANEGILVSTGYSLTGSDASNMLDFAGTWNTTGSPTALKFNITNTASGASSKLLDFQFGGTSKFNIAKDGSIFSDTGAGAWVFKDANNSGIYNYGNAEGFIMAGDPKLIVGQTTLSLAQAFYVSWSGTPFVPDASGDLYISRSAAATLTMGIRGTATPTGQTFGTAAAAGSNITGAAMSFIAGNGTGTGGSGAINFQTAAVGTTGSTANTLVNVFILKPSGVLNYPLAPTSSAGLSSGDIYTNAGILTRVP